MSDRTTLGGRMKMYERLGSAADVFMPGLPIIVRLDGRAFHSFTRGMDRPFDSRLAGIMDTVTEDLAKESNACIAYTQSDEISLLLYADGVKSQVYFGGKRDKITSILASLATLQFNRYVALIFPDKSNMKPVFDARAFTVPSKTEAANYFIWREQDAVRNSISMAAQAHFSHESLHGLDSKQMQEKLFAETGVNWNDYSSRFKRGSYRQKYVTLRKYTASEIEFLPPKHAARSNPGLIVERQEWRFLDCPRMTAVTNKEAVLFDGATPQVLS